MCEPMKCGLGSDKGCGADIWFVITEKGARMPVNKDGTSHFTNCVPARHCFHAGVTFLVVVLLHRRREVLHRYRLPLD